MAVFKLFTAYSQISMRLLSVIAPATRDFAAPKGYGAVEWRPIEIGRLTYMVGCPCVSIHVCVHISESDQLKPELCQIMQKRVEKAGLPVSLRRA